MAKMYPHGIVVNGEFAGLNVYVWAENKSLMIVDGVLDNGFFGRSSTNKCELNASTIKAYEDLGSVTQNASPKAVSTATFWFGVGAGVLASQLGKQEVHTVVVQYSSGKVSMLQLNSWAYRNFIAFTFALPNSIARAGRQTAEPEKLKAGQQTRNILINTGNIDASLKRIELFLEDEEWKTALEYCDAVLDMEPTNAQAYIYRLFAELHIRNAAALSERDDAFWENKNYEKAIRFGDEAVTRAIREPAEQRIKQRKQAEIDEQERIANQKEQEESERKQRELDEQKKQEALTAFWKRHPAEQEQVVSEIEKLWDKRNQLEKRQKEQPHQKKEYLDKQLELVVERLARIDIVLKRDFLRSPEFTGQEIQILQEGNSVWNALQKYDEEERRTQEKKRKRKRNALITLAAAAAVLAAAGVVTNFVIIPNARYQEALQSVQAAKYDDAIRLFEDLGKYENSPRLLLETRYLKAQSLLSEGKKADAAALFAEAAGYKDSKALAEQYRPFWMEKNAKTLSAGDTLTVGVKSDGSAIAVGNKDGQFDMSSWKEIAAVSAGYSHTVGLKSDGTAVAVGYNKCGECDVSSWKDIIAVSAGLSHTVGLKSDGTVVAVGYNNEGECNVSGWKDIVAISAGSAHTVGLKSDGTVIAVGDNYNGQCNVSGWKDIISISAGSFFTVGLKSDGTVVAVGSNKTGECDVSGWRDIISVSAGGAHTVGLKSDGTVVAVGHNKDGACDVPGWKDIISVSAGGSHTVGLKSDGTVVAVGSNKDGQCNANYVAAVSTPEVRSSTKIVTAGLEENNKAAISGWSDIIAISASTKHTAGLKSDGTVLAAGYNKDGRCNVSKWKDIVAISAGETHTVGLTSQKTVVAAGLNTDGQCKVSAWSDIIAVSAGGVDTVGYKFGVVGQIIIKEGHTVGLKFDGTVVAVGSNDNGQCNVSGWTDIVAVSAGGHHSVGLKSDGSVLAVGNNGNGECNVSGWTDIIAVSAGDYWTVGLKSDGTVVATGSNLTHVCDVSSWNNIVAISAGENVTLGLKTDGTVVATGNIGYDFSNELSNWQDIVVIEAAGVNAESGGYAIGLESKLIKKAVNIAEAGWKDIKIYEDK